MKKIRAKLGSFLNDGISSGFINSEFSEIQLSEMKKIIINDYKNIEIDLKEQLYRLDNYLKKEFGAIFRNEDFVKWFFDKKKMNQWGDNLPKITDSELIEYSRLYIKYLHSIKVKEVVVYNENFWLLDHNLLIELAEDLRKNGFIDDAELFVDTFSNKNSEKVDWKTHKTTLIFLISKLKLSNFVQQDISENNFIESKFSINRKIIRNIKQSKEQMSSKPKNYEIINSFIEKYKNTIPLPTNKVK